MQAAPLITEELLDEDFFAELDALIDKDFEENREIQEENRNCGTGAVGGKQGFQPGNKCAGTGEKSKGKPEGKKKNVHSDWDDGKTAAEAGWVWTTKVSEPSGSPFEPPTRKLITHKGIPEDEGKAAFNYFTTDSGKEVGLSLYPMTNSGQPTRMLDFNVDGNIRVSDEGEAMSIIRQVSNNTISMFKDESINGLNFSALRSDGSGRTKLYVALSKRLAKKTDSEAFASIKNMQDGRKTIETKFYVVKKSALKKFKKNSTIFPTDGDLFEPKPAAGRPVGKWHTVPIDDFDWGTAFEKQYSEEERSSEEKSEPWFLDELLKDENFVEQVEKMLESEEDRSVDFDGAFFAELDELVDADFRNCGTGAVGGKQGFQPGNKCAGTGEKSKGKAEGKKKDVHSDWISKDPIGWEEFKDDNSDPNSLMNYESMFHSDSGDITVYGTPNFYSRDNANKYGGEKPGKDDGVFKFNFSKEGFGYAASNTGDALSTMRKVMHRAVDLYNKPDVDALEFAASNKDKGRVRTYAYLTRWAQKRFPETKAYYKEVEGGMHIFVIANKKAQNGYLEWDYKNSANPYWEFEHQDQFTGVDGRSAEDKKEKFLIPESILTKEFFEELGRLLDEDYEAYNSRSVDFDDAFFAELDELVDADFRNCGTGAVGGKQGFQPGNKCAGTGEKSKGKAEGKKKDVHSDWDDGKTAAEAGWEYWKSKSREYVPGVEPWERSRNRFIVKNAADDEEIDVRIISSGSGEIHPRTLSFEVNGSQAVTGKGRGVAMKVIREVANRTTSLFQDENVSGLIFTSDLDDGPGRAKLYKRMSEMLANKYDGISLAKPTLGGNLAFSVVKKSLWEEIKVKMADKTSSGYKWKKSKDLTVKKINDFFNPTDGLDFYDGDDVDEQWDQIPDNTGIDYRFMEVPNKVEKTYFFDELLNDESFMQEIERMFDSIENRNCGTGAVGGKQGFQPGNKCAGTGEKSKGKKATTDELVSTGSKQLKETGGFTVHPITGKSPKKGYMVATVPGEELKVKKLTENKLSGFIQKNASNFAKDNKLHVGGWYNVDDGKIYLDLSTNVSSLPKAKSLAKKYKQISIYDIANKAEINTEDLWKGDNANEGQERSDKRRTGSTRSSRGGVSAKRETAGRQRGLDPVRLQSGRRERPSGDAESDQRDGREVRIAKGREVGSKSQEERNCGTGAVGGKQGFQPGNKCAGTGEKTKAKQDAKKEKQQAGPKNSDLFPSGSQGFRTAVDDATTASGLNSDDVWDRSKGFRSLPDRSTIESFAKEQQSKSGKAMTKYGRESYDALIDDIGKQYQALTDAGLKVYAWEGKGEPYAKIPGGTKVNSNMMRKMVAKDGEFRFFMTDKGFGTGAATKNHPMLKMTKYKTSDGKPLIANDLFRVVHDMVAHVRGGHSFSTKGEFNGMLTHATTLNKKAWPALFSETFAQNSVYEITNKFAPQNAYGSRKGAKLIKVEVDSIMKENQEVERAVPSGDSDEPLGYWHLKQRPWLVNKLNKDEPSEEKENAQ